MTPRQAAEIIGCTPGQVRWLIRQNRINSRKIKTDPNITGCEHRFHGKMQITPRNEPGIVSSVLTYFLHRQKLDFFGFQSPSGWLGRRRLPRNAPEFGR